MFYNSFCTFAQLNRNYLDEVFNFRILEIKWLKYFHSLFCFFRHSQHVLVLFCLFFVCFHPYDKSMCFFCFCSLQIFSFFVFDVFSLSQSLKMLPQNFFLPFGPCRSVLNCFTFSALYGLLIFLTFFQCKVLFLSSVISCF